MRAYRALLSRARLQTHLAATVESERVYYSLRNPLRQPTYDRSFGVYFGRLERGGCVDAADVDHPSPAGLSADQIRYVCTARPDSSKVFQRSRTHKGSEGLLHGQVQCRITRPYSNVRDSASGE